MEGYIGQIIYFGGNFAPREFAFCNGSLMPIAQNSALFSILGITFGGDGKTTFSLPDTQGRIIVGSGQASANNTGGAQPSSANPVFTIGQMGGKNTVTLSPANLPSHSHTATLMLRTASGSSPTPIADGTLGAAAAAGPGSANLYNTTPIDASNSVPQSPNSINVGLTGGNQPLDIMPPFQTLSTIICLNGLYPSRG